MTKSVKNKLKLVISIAIILCFVFLVIVFPFATFRNNEKIVEQAARRYYELNPNELPTGERISTVSLDTLYHKSFMQKDVYIPYTKKTCSITNSWAKVKRENGEYKYYVYLECGVLSSSIDHEGPVIKLNGGDEITIDIGDTFKEPGVKSVIDNSDGKLKTSDVTIKGKVDTNKVGTYQIKYIAYDNFKNKTTKIRNVKVVQKLNKTIKKSLDKTDYYSGFPENNYIYFSNMLFRIIGIDSENNIKIVADKDIANVNFDAIDKWLKYYENNLTDSAKKYIVETKYCNMKADDTTLDTTQCSSYSEKKKIGILSIDDMNRANTEEGSFLILNTITWTANSKDSKTAYATREVFADYDGIYMAFEKAHNFGVRPVITIKGDSLLIDGNGTISKPYKMNDYKTAKPKTNLNKRYVGEYVYYSGMLWRIINIENDGTIKVAAEQSLYDTDGELATAGYSTKLKGIVTYNPEQKGNPGYIINNRSSEYFDTDYFVNHEFTVPIYKGEPKYGEEVKTKKYKAKIISANMYEMFSATTDDPAISSYWFVNSTESRTENPGMSEIGVPLYGPGAAYYHYGIRPVGYLNSSCIISSGDGTKNNPFIIKK